ncbi:FHIPEP family type III secretion protein [bacterium]|nr:FHIPEP family type III secretion protein [bacterium]
MIEKIKNLLKLNTKTKLTVETQINDMFKSLTSDELKIALGDDLTFIAPKICYRIQELRKKIKDDNGFIMPTVRLFDDNKLQENEYQISIRSKKIFTGYTVPNEDYACNEILNSLEASCMDNLELVFTNELTEKYINAVQSQNSLLIWNVSHLVPVTGIKAILINLLKNGKSLKDITFIFEKICEAATQEKDWFSMRDPEKISKIINSQII